LFRRSPCRSYIRQGPLPTHGYKTARSPASQATTKIANSPVKVDLPFEFERLGSPSVLQMRCVLSRRSQSMAHRMKSSMTQTRRAPYNTPAGDLGTNRHPMRAVWLRKECCKHRYERGRNRADKTSRSFKKSEADHARMRATSRINSVKRREAEALKQSYMSAPPPPPPESMN